MTWRKILLCSCHIDSHLYVTWDVLSLSSHVYVMVTLSSSIYILMTVTLTSSIYIDEMWSCEMSYIYRWDGSECIKRLYKCVTYRWDGSECIKRLYICVTYRWDESECDMMTSHLYVTCDMTSHLYETWAVLSCVWCDMTMKENASHLWKRIHLIHMKGVIPLWKRIHLMSTLRHATLCICEIYSALWHPYSISCDPITY